MKLSICNFQDIARLDLTSESNGIIHISGKSGCGKSAIFEAIYWCLYGTLKDVEKRGAEGAKLFVSYKPNAQTKIYRQRNPKKFTVTHQGRVFEDSLAQQKVIELMGADKEGWIATSYVMQGEPHFILTLPAKERYQVLLRMSMRGEDAEPYIKKLQDKIKSLREESETKKKEYEKNYTAYEGLCKRYNAGVNDVLSKEEAEEARQTVSELAEALEVLEKDLSLAKTIESKAEMLDKSLTRIKKQLEPLKEYSIEIYQTLQEDNRLWTQAEKLRVEAAELQVNFTQKRQKLETLGVTSDSADENTLREEIAKAEFLEGVISKQKAVTEALGIAYEAAVISKELENCQDLINACEQASLYNLVRKKMEEREVLLKQIPETPSVTQKEAEAQVQFLKKEIQNLRETLRGTLEQLGTESTTRKAEALRVLKDKTNTVLTRIKKEKEEQLAVTESDYTQKIATQQERSKELEKDLEQLERSRAVHKCPNCSVSLRYVNNKPEMCSQEPFDVARHTHLKEELERMRTLRAQLETQLLAERKTQKSALEQALAAQKLSAEKEEQALLASLETAEKQAKEVLEREHTAKLSDLQEQLSKQERIVETWQTMTRLSKAVENCNSELQSLPPLPAVAAELSPQISSETLKTRLEKLRTLQYHTPSDTSSQELKKTLEAYKLAAEIAVLKTRLEEVRSQLGSFSGLKKIEEETVQNYAQSLQKKQSLTAQREAYEKDHALLEKTRASAEIEKELETNRARKLSLERKLAKSKKAIILVREYHKLEAASTECEELHQKALNFQQLLGILQEAVLDSLMSMVRSTNLYLAAVTPQLFEEPIEIKLSTEKELKSGVKKKEITLMVNYKGGLVRNFKKGLSCGEKARINTVLSLAFSRYCDSKVLILDDAVSLMGDLDAQKLMDLIRADDYGSSSRVVLLASHNCNSGLVDKVVEFAEIRKGAEEK